MRTLALDLGSRRIGVAISDTLSMFARPLEVFERTSRIADFAHMQALIDADKGQSVVAGLPLNMDGTEGKQAAWVRDYAAALGEAISMPVVLWDERLTTEEAKDILRAQGKRPSKDWIDAIAAAVILQNYLDAQIA